MGLGKAWEKRHSRMRVLERVRRYGLTALIVGLLAYSAIFYYLNYWTLATLGPSGLLAILLVYLTLHEKIRPWRR